MFRRSKTLVISEPDPTYKVRTQSHYLLVVEYVQLKRLLTNRVDDKKVNAVAIRLRFTPSCKNSWSAIFTPMI